MKRIVLVFVFALITYSSSSRAFAQAQRWTEQKANSWYEQQPWLVGSNYIPADAINELEMWQEQTFDLPQIEKELGWAEGLGMNTMRVFLHDLLWEQDAGSFKQRVDAFLRLASKHHIRPMFVLFAGMLLVAETIYVHVLCPRANPKAAEAVVPKRGVLKPVTGK